MKKGSDGLFGFIVKIVFVALLIFTNKVVCQNTIKVRSNEIIIPEASTFLDGAVMPYHQPTELDTLMMQMVLSIGHDRCQWTYRKIGDVFGQPLTEWVRVCGLCNYREEFVTSIIPNNHEPTTNNR